MRNNNIPKRVCRTYMAGLMIIILLAVLPAEGLCAEDDAFDVHKISERVYVFAEKYRERFNANIVVIQTPGGLVVVDSLGSPAAGRMLREQINRDLGRDDFLYLINSHGHWDHCRGNNAFDDVTIIAHRNVLNDYGMIWNGINSVRGTFTGARDGFIERLNDGETTDEQKTNLQSAVAYTDSVLESLQDDPEMVKPEIIFSDAMTLRLDDLTIELVWFGEAHSTSDILVYVPEEKILITGDLFLEKTIMPSFAFQRTLPVERWLSLINRFLDDPDGVTRVIHTHIDIMDRDNLVFWRDYISGLWAFVKHHDEAGSSLQDIMDTDGLRPSLDYLETCGWSTAQIDRFHHNATTAFWRQLKTSATELIRKNLAMGGVDAAWQTFRAMQTNHDPDILFDENDFNAFGYQLLQAGQMDAAVAIFEMNTIVFADSANTFDSLGEALLAVGDTARGLEMYRKSLELNPENENARNILKQHEVK